MPKISDIFIFLKIFILNNHGPEIKIFLFQFF